METVEKPEEKYPFDMVWQGLMENREQLNRLIKELRDSGKETDKRIKEVSKQIGGMAASNGAMAEESIFNALEKDMTFAGIEFDDIQKNLQIVDYEKLKTLTELDVVMRNGDALAIIEVKYKVDKKDVKELLLNKLNYVKQYFPKLKDYKIILGVGGMSFDDDAIKEANENGIGIIKVIGDKVEYDTERIKYF
jgi:hypothetical protein